MAPLDGPAREAAGSAAGELESVPCPVCGRGDGAPYTRILGWSFLRCDGCGLVYMSPRPSAARLMALYDERYFASDDPHCGYAVYEADRDSIREKSERLLDMLARHSGPPGRLLDVGCAYGYLLEVAAEHGWQVAGVEPAAGVARRVGERLGLEIPHDLAAASHPDASFDAVALWDVIEHLADPRGTLVEIRRLLKPDGVLSIVTPDVGSLAARLLGRRWEEIRKMPEHVCLFSRRSLTALLDATGFVPVEWGTVGKRMALDEVVTRLTPTAPLVWRGIHAALRATGADGLVGYFDPRWKLSLVVRPR